MLQDLHTIPINTAVVAGLYPHIKSKAQKVADLERAGSLIRLKRNLYVVSPSLSGVPLSTELIANQLYGPSYLSLQSALRYYGLIPEAVYQHLSMTIKHSRSFTTPVGALPLPAMHARLFCYWAYYCAAYGLCFYYCYPRKSPCRPYHLH
ncbi:type IV toxin-antitoxin system AbiEi family antitoxin domain-containing protein [Capnocytophaga haemolytica]